MLLFFDTETSGLPRSWKAPLEDLENWPRLVQLAWIVTEDDGRVAERREALIRPEGFTIDEAATAVHGISTEQALEYGVALRPVLTILAHDLARCRLVVAHNYDFDRKIVGAEFLRLGNPDSLKSAHACCTMRASTDFCAIPGNFGYKWPTLDELHRHLFATGFDGAHGALADTEACMRCYFALREKGIVE